MTSFQTSAADDPSRGVPVTATMQCLRGVRALAAAPARCAATMQTRGMALDQMDHSPLHPWSGSSMPPLRIHEMGSEILQNPLYNKGTAFSYPERDRLRIRGLIPPRRIGWDIQKEKVMKTLRSLSSDLSRNTYLASVQVPPPHHAFADPRTSMTFSGTEHRVLPAGPNPATAPQHAPSTVGWRISPTSAIQRGLRQQPRVAGQQRDAVPRAAGRQHGVPRAHHLHAHGRRGVQAVRVRHPLLREFIDYTTSMITD